MGDEICNPSEDLIRAVPEALYAPGDGRASTALFQHAGTSVSRLVVLPLERLWEIHLAELDKPGNRLVALAQFNLGRVQLCLAEIDGSSFTVVAKPTPSNPAHAEIQEGIASTPRRRILAVLKLLEYHTR